MHQTYNFYFNKKPSKWISNLSTVFTGIIQGLFVFIVVAFIFGVRPFIVIGYSMEPIIPILSVTLDFKQQTYKVGDVITFKTSAGSSIRNTHRIVTIVRDETGNIDYYITHGDNPNIDANTREAVSPALIEGKVIFTIPAIGEWFLVLKSNLALTVTTLIAIYVVIYITKQKQSLTY